MRIISGKFRGRKLLPPEDSLTRPTSDRVREAIFNILENSLGIKWEKTRVLDLYAGTGSLGIEALSRGASFCLFVDHHSAAIEVIKKNTAPFSQIDLWKKDASCLKQNTNLPFDLVFLDPPYKKNLIPITLEKLLSYHYLSKDCFIVIELSSKEEINTFNSIEIIKIKNYGNTKIIFSKHKK